MVERLEVAWTLTVVVLLAGVAAYSTLLLYHLDALPEHVDEYVNVIAHQWYWEFCYPQNNTCYNSSYDPSTNTTTGGDLWAQPGWVVQVNVTSADVVHSFNIPQLGVRIDAFPARTNYFAFAVPADAAVGTLYLIQCTEFCGTFHGTMRSFVDVVAHV